MLVIIATAPSPVTFLSLPSRQSIQGKVSQDLVTLYMLLTLKSLYLLLPFAVFLLTLQLTLGSFFTTPGMFKYIANKRLFVSEPNPAMFGNAGNLATSKYWTNKNWLKSRFHFSFAEYYSPDNTNFGTLRVMNDDLVQPDRGFGTHPHNNMEICTYIVDGNLTHQDSMGTAETLSRGAIQFMTAGTGIRHSEHNLNKTEPLRFIQMWIQPRERNLTPNYGSGTGTFEDRHNRFAHLVSDVQNPISETPVKINQDVNIFVSEFDAGKDVEFNLKNGRQAYVLCIEGKGVAVGMDGKPTEQFMLQRHDAGEAYGPSTIKFSNTDESSAHILIVEMSNDNGGGRTDL